MTETQTMKAVVFDGPYQVSVQDRPIPTLQKEHDVILKVEATALCGSELHVYRGIEPSGTGHIMGHEFVGTIVQKGSAVSGFQIGDKVVTPFTISCGSCFYCICGDTARCVESKVFGSSGLDGGQAEFVRVPFADNTILKAPDSIPGKALVLMADIFPTGYYGVQSAISMAPSVKLDQATMVVIGCGPVGLCAIVAAMQFKLKRVFAVDGVESRLEQAKQLGAEPLNYQSGAEDIIRQVKEATGGRGADFAVEVVGLSPALRTAFDIIRPFGVISSIGVHNAEIPWTATEGYDKNVRLQMGRCPVRRVFDESLAVLARTHSLFDFMFDQTMPLSEAKAGYELFEKRQAQKVLFVP